ncbi:MAG: hypothetical protein IKE17_15655 [Clostridia bacterium]|nr:hypothetical protein [Clostridia bacterium]MBR2799156.1 hypothetical protein [Clostridia bacterium]
MSDNIATAKAVSERANVTIDGKTYEGFDLYTALEEVSMFLSKIRLIVQDVYESSDTYAVSYGKALRAGIYPSTLYTFGHEVYIRSGIMLDNVNSIESMLSRFDIHLD